MYVCVCVCAGKKFQVTTKPWTSAFTLFRTSCLMTSWWEPVLTWAQKAGFKSGASLCQVHISSRRQAERKSISSQSSTNFPSASFHFPICTERLLPDVALSPPPSSLPSPPPNTEQVPFGPLAFMPGKLVHTNEVTALLGDNWFARCSAKQAQKLVAHRMKCEFAFPPPSAIHVYIRQRVLWHRIEPRRGWRWSNRLLLLTTIY